MSVTRVLYFVFLLTVGGTLCRYYLQTRLERHHQDLRISMLKTRIPATKAERDAYFQQHSATDPPWVIFYNIYVPSTRSGFKHAMRIVHEQLHQIATSYAAHTHVTVYYNTIGIAHELQAYQCIQSTCHKYAPRIVCLRMDHLAQAYEEVTLQGSHDFCHAHPHKHIIYLHNKGSYHPYKANTHWRRHLTAAATSRACLESLNATAGNNRQCNVCGLQYVPVWGSCIAGNMFAADCAYVNRLVPALTFPATYTRMVRNMCRWQQQGHWTTTLYRHDDGDTRMFLGLDRWSLEMWVGSHPSIQPCDVSDTLSLEYWQKHNHMSEFHWHMAPHQPITADWFLLQQDQLQDILSNVTRLRREYFLLAGQLFKWIELYNQVPPMDSWIWTWFPDGSFWQEALQQSTNWSNAVETITGAYHTLANESMYDACRVLLSD
jgi:hypothetical protein